MNEWMSEWMNDSVSTTRPWVAWGPGLGLTSCWGCKNQNSQPAVTSALHAIISFYKISRAVLLNQALSCPPGDIWQCPWRHFLLLSWLGCGCYWHLVSGDQGCCEHPTVHRTAPTTRSYRLQNVKSAEVEEPWPKWEWLQGSTTLQGQGSVCASVMLLGSPTLVIIWLPWLQASHSPFQGETNQSLSIHLSKENLLLYGQWLTQGHMFTRSPITVQGRLNCRDWLESTDSYYRTGPSAQNKISTTWVE